MKEHINWGVTTEQNKKQEINWGTTTNQFNNDIVQDNNEQQVIDWNRTTNKGIDYNIESYSDNFQDIQTPKEFFGDICNGDKLTDKKPCLELRKLILGLFNFNDRTTRREYIIGLYQYTCIFIILSILCINLIPFNVNFIVCVILCLLYVLGCFSINVRRLHDIGKNGKYVFTLFIPIWNIITALQMCFVDSKDDNKWGMNPKRFNEYKDRPLSKSILLVFIFIIISVLCLCLLGVKGIQSMFDEINARQLYDEMEENYQDMYNEEININDNIKEYDESWKDELKNYKKEEKKDYLWGDDTENHPWTEKPESYDSFTEDSYEQTTLQEIENLLN